MLLIVRPCPRLQPLIFPRRPRSGHGSHVGGGGSGQGGSRRSGSGGTGVNTAGASGGAGAGGGGGSSAATTGSDGGSSAATTGGDGGSSAATTCSDGGSSAATTGGDGGSSATTTGGDGGSSAATTGGDGGSSAATTGSDGGSSAATTGSDGGSSAATTGSDGGSSAATTGGDGGSSAATTCSDGGSSAATTGGDGGSSATTTGGDGGSSAATTGGDGGSSAATTGSDGGSSAATTGSDGGSSAATTGSDGGSSAATTGSDGGSSAATTGSDGGSSAATTSSDGGSSAATTGSDGGSSAATTGSDGGSSAATTGSDGDSSAATTGSDGGSSAATTGSDGGSSAATTGSDGGSSAATTSSDGGSSAATTGSDGDSSAATTGSDGGSSAATTGGDGGSSAATTGSDGGSSAATTGSDGGSSAATTGSDGGSSAATTGSDGGSSAATTGSDGGSSAATTGGDGGSSAATTGSDGGSSAATTGGNGGSSAATTGSDGGSSAATTGGDGGSSAATTGSDGGSSAATTGGDGGSSAATTGGDGGSSAATTGSDGGRSAATTGSDGGSSAATTGSDGGSSAATTGGDGGSSAATTGSDGGRSAATTGSDGGSSAATTGSDGGSSAATTGGDGGSSAATTGSDGGRSAATTGSDGGSSAATTGSDGGSSAATTGSDGGKSAATTGSDGGSSAATAGGGWLYLGVASVQARAVCVLAPSDKYINLKAIQDDMILMVKNAHHFNEPNSEIYKMASALKKHIVAKCAELERKYQTVVKTLPVGTNKGSMKRPSLSESSGRPSPALPGPSQEVGSKVKHEEHESSDEELGSEGSSDVYDMSEVVEQREEGKEEEEDMESQDEKDDELMRKMKKEQSSSDEDPIRRVLKYKRLPSIKKRLMAIYRVLVQHRDPLEGRIITDLFVKRPSPKMYPEYYTIIKRPIDLREIYQKIRELKYDRLEDLLVDVNQMVTNACQFNEEGSQVYTDALTLGRLAQEAYRVLQEGWPETRGRDKAQERLSISEPVHLAPPTPSNVQQLRMGQLLEAVKSCAGTNGRLVWGFFRELPCAGMGQDYLAIVKKNIDVQTISNKLQAGQYSNVELLYDDIIAMCTNVCKVSAPESDLYKDAMVLYEAAMQKYLQLTAPERDAYVLPNAIYSVQQILRDILMRTLDYKEASGKKPLDSLLGVTVTQEAAREKSESAPRRRSFGLAKMRMWAGEGKYRRLDQLQADLLAVLRQAREEGGRDSQMHVDAVTLQRVFIGVRDEICDDGKRLWSPALEELTLSHLDAEVPMVSSLSEERESTPAESSASESAGDKVVLPDETSREYVQETMHEGKMYRTGDIVYISPRKSGSKSHIALIEGIWKDGSGTFWLDGCWFYRPEETFHLSSRKFYEKEVFKSDFHSIARFSEVQGTCYVMFIKDYVWNFLPGPQPKLVLRGSQLTLNRVPSVFATKMNAGGEKEVDAEERVEEEVSMNDSLQMSFYYNFHSVPVSVTNPDHQCTYYEQFCIDDNTFKTAVGDCFAHKVAEDRCDFVYVRSDQEFPYIARIDRMWTDANDDPWFRGPWFVRPEEVSHLPTRMFLHKELFMSNIQDTNPMRSIIGKCAVLFVNDYCKLRPTEVPEEDVFVCECRYNEVDKDIRRLKGLRRLRLSYLARSTPTDLVLEAFKLFDDDIHHCFMDCIGFATLDEAWCQAQLGLNSGGLGLRSLSLHSSSAYIASVCSSGVVDSKDIHLTNAIDRFNSHVSPIEKLSVNSIISSPVSQKLLSSKVNDHCFQDLFDRSSPANKARLLSVSAPHATSWLSVIPSTSQGLHLDPIEFRVAVKWWLGLDTSQGSQCAFCPAHSLDPLRHHTLTCKCGGDVVLRHNALRDTLVHFLHRAHASVQVEVGAGLFPDHSQSRPAYILLQNWNLGRPVALDISVVSPLNPSTLAEAGATFGAVLEATESRKHQANDEKCSALGWVSTPLAVDSYGAWGKEASLFLAQVAAQLTIHKSLPKSQASFDLFSNLSICLIRANARAILRRV
eukprot:Em0001g2754a